MNASDWIALWGAILATLLAIYQILQHYRDKPRLSVDAGMTYSALNEEDADKAKGTPIRVRRDEDDVLEEALVAIKVANKGSKAIQISAIAIESLSGDSLTIHEVMPEALPTILEPLTSTVIEIQKELIDSAEELTFFGVVDGLGRRYAIDKETCKAIAETCWSLPSRRRVYRRKDDPSKKVVAFQIRDKSSMRQRPAPKRRPLVIASRPSDEDLGIFR